MWHALSSSSQNKQEVQAQIEEQYNVYIHILHPMIELASEAQTTVEQLLQQTALTPSQPIKPHPQQGLVLYVQCSLQQLDLLTQTLTKAGLEVVL